MPFNVEHSGRVKNPNLFVPASFRRKEITDGISIVIGKLKTDPTGSTVVQTYRFNKVKFTAEQARKWLKDHKIDTISFEAAKNEVTETQFKNRLNEVIWRHKNGRVIGIRQQDDKIFSREDKIVHYQTKMDKLNTRLLNAEAEHARHKKAIQQAKENGIDEDTFKKLLADELKTQEHKDWLENRINYTKDRHDKAHNEG